MPQYIKYLAAVPIHHSTCFKLPFFDINISHGSVAKHLRCCATYSYQLKPNSITLASSELAPNKLRTSFERAPK